MSYLSRLIADSTPGPAGLRPTAGPARLDVDVLREVAARPAVALSQANSPSGFEPVAYARRAVSTDGPARDSSANPPIPLHRDVPIPTALPPLRTESPNPSSPAMAGLDPVRDPAPLVPEPDPAPLAPEPLDVAHEVVVVGRHEPALQTTGSPPESTDPTSHLPTDAEAHALAAPKLKDVEVATQVIAPPRDDRPGEPPPAPAQLADAAPPLSSLDLLPEDVVAERPELQQVSLSIGTIEVVVDAPSGAPPQLALLSPADGGRERPAPDDPIMRLRRRYVTWPEGR